MILIDFDGRMGERNDKLFGHIARVGKRNVAKAYRSFCIRGVYQNSILICVVVDFETKFEQIEIIRFNFESN